MPVPDHSLPRTLKELRASGWQSRSVKHELRDNFVAALARGDDLFPGVVGYEDTVIPELSNAIISGHDILFLGEKGQAKSRLMRMLVRFLDPMLPCLDVPGAHTAPAGIELFNHYSGICASQRN